MPSSNIAKWLILILVLVGLGLVAVFWRQPPAPVANQEENRSAEAPSTAPPRNDLNRLASIALTDYRGRPVSLADFKKPVVVVNSWAVWCPFCRKELADFAALQEVFPEQVAMVAIDRAEPLAKVKGFTDGLGVSDKMTFLLDSEDDFYKLIGGFSMPETVFFDARGAIAFHKRGPMELPEMKAQVEKILAASQS